MMLQWFREHGVTDSLALCGDSDALLLCAAGTAAADLCCSICYKTFKSRHSLRNHRALHEGRTVCPLCGRVFSTLSNLSEHRRAFHAPGRPGPTLPPQQASPRWSAGAGVAGTGRVASDTRDWQVEERSRCEER